jgi:hypothetical protein
MKSSSGLRRRLPASAWRHTGAWAAFAVALALLLTAATAHANHGGRMYIKKNGKIAIGISPSGNFFTSGFHQFGQVDPQGLQIKRNGVTLFSIGPEDPANTNRFGTLFLAGFGSVTENINLPVGAGSMRFSNNGWQVVELLTSGDAAVRLEAIQGFGYRTDFRYLRDLQRQMFIETIGAMDSSFYPGTAGVAVPSGDGYVAMGGVSYWDKAAQMHQVYFHNIHSGPSFLPWHRQLLAWMEGLMRTYDPLVTLPYWQWESHPVNDLPAIVGPSGWLGQDQERIGYPFDSLDNGDVFAGSWEQPLIPGTGSACDQYAWDGNPLDDGTMLCDPSRPPQTVDRHVCLTCDVPGVILTDGDVIASPSWEQMRAALEDVVHNYAHVPFLCNHGEVSSSRAPMDPMFWLLHANVDRLWANWQDQDPTRKTVAGAYGGELGSLNGVSIEPWTSGTGAPHTTKPLRPWTTADGYQQPITYTNPAILVPVRYYQ